MNIITKVHKWLIAKLVTKDLIKLVTSEAKALKAKSTQDERNRLDFDTFNPETRNGCIFGQMTGDCNSDRANALILKCAKRVYNSPDTPTINAIEESVLNGPPRKIDYGYRIYSYFSPIEKFIGQRIPSQKENNKILIDYLKGETDTLKFIE